MRWAMNVIVKKTITDIEDVRSAKGLRVRTQP
jgi:hypothetical protein